MEQLVGEVLGVWREAERLLDELPPLDPDHETVRLAVHSLQSTYQAVTTGDATRTPSVVAGSRDTIRDARALLTSVRQKRLARLDLEHGLIVCIPSSDPDLVAIVHSAFESISWVTPEKLELALRETYPKALVRRVERPGEPMPSWYVFREVTDGGR